MAASTSLEASEKAMRMNLSPGAKFSRFLRMDVDDGGKKMRKFIIQDKSVCVYCSFARSGLCKGKQSRL